MKHLVPVILATLFFCSCNKVVLDETHTFENNTWMRFEPESYQFNIRNIDDCYDIIATLKVDTNQFFYKDLPLVVNMNSANGDQRMFYSHVALTNKSGKRQGETIGCYQTVTTKMREYVFFNTSGEQTVEVKQGTSKYELPGVVSFGLKVEKASMRLPE